MQQNRIGGTSAQPQRWRRPFPGARPGGPLPALGFVRWATGVRHAGLAIAFIVVVLMAWRTVDYQSEESLIYARYARNFADGHGLVFNDGDAHNATASYLHAWLLVPFAFSGFAVPVAAALLGAIAVAATCFLLIRYLIPPRDGVAEFAGAAAGVLYAVSALNFASLGVEMPVAIFFATAALCAARADRAVVAGMLCALAVAARPEFVVFAAALVAITAIARRSSAALIGVAFLGGFAPFVLFSAVYYTELFPRALLHYSLLGSEGFAGPEPVFLLGAETVLDRLSAGASTLLTFAAVAVAVLAAGTFGRLRVRRKLAAVQDSLLVPGWVLVVFAVCWVLLFSFLEVPAYAWHVAPLVWAATTGTAIAAAAGARQAARLNPRSQPFVTAFVGVGLVALAIALVARLDNAPRGRDGEYVAIAQWLEANGGDDCTVGATEVGHLAWYSDCRTSDISGRITPANASAVKRGDFDTALARTAPRFVVTSAPLAPYEHGLLTAVLAGRYRLVDGVAFPGHLLFEATNDPVGPGGGLLGTNIGNGSPALNENLYSVGGDFKPALFMHVSQQRDFRVTGAGLTFETFVGIADGAERSDGVTFIVRADGREIERRVLKPGAWARIIVPLPETADGDLTLTLETDRAPGGKTNFGWALWGEPRVVASP